MCEISSITIDKWYRQKYIRKGRCPFILWVWRLCEKTIYSRLSVRMHLINLLCLSNTRALILFSMKFVNYLLTLFQPIWHNVIGTLWWPFTAHSRYFAVILCQSLKWTPRVSPHKQATGSPWPFRYLWFQSWPLCGIFFVVLDVMYKLIGPRHIEDGRTWSYLFGRVNTNPTFGNMYSEMRMNNLRLL